MSADAGRPAVARPSGIPGLDVLVTRDELAARVAELGASLRRDYVDRDPVLVTVLKGATLFLADLVREAGLDAEIDFMSISSFGAARASSGVVRIEKDLAVSIEGRDVIIVEDIVDTGLTLHYLMRVLAARDPRSLEVCTLLDKDVRRIVELPMRYRGFSIPDRFVIGYGLDAAERYRNVEAIYVVDDPSALRDDPDCFAGALFGGDADSRA